MQKELMRLDFLMNPDAVQKMQTAQRYYLAADRSVYWVEQICGITMDRTCSRGVLSGLVRMVIETVMELVIIVIEAVIGSFLVVGFDIEVCELKVCFLLNANTYYIS